MYFPFFRQCANDSFINLLIGLFFFLISDKVLLINKKLIGLFFIYLFILYMKEILI